MARTQNFENKAIHVSNVSIVGNIVLSALKLLAGIIAHSSAMISDAIHSASDVFSSIVVIIGIKLASEDSDKEHPYGHERLESVAAIVLAIVLAITGLFIGYNAVGKLTSGEFKALQTPGVLALCAAVISICVKEAMYWYTRHYAKDLNSSALMADAWHHRSDALSSIGSLIGIAGARMGYLWFDSLASLIICIFILKAAYDIFTNAINQMVDHSCDESLEKALVECATTCCIDFSSQNTTFSNSELTPCKVGNIQTREFGNRIYVDLTIYADGRITLNESDALATRVHDSIEQQFPQVKHIVVIVKPIV